MKKLVFISILLAFVVIILGAYTRLTDAGLGCPDWPGCYGQLLVPNTETTVNAANKAFPERPVEAQKAWNEMIHRYFASALGLCILIIFIWSLVRRLRDNSGPIKLPFLLLILVCFQGALGMWTVTLNLLPVVVMGHLLGGFTVLSCLFLLYIRLKKIRVPGGDVRIRRFAKLGLIGIVLLVGQIALGGWTSANYASLACTELPICQGNWVDKLDIGGSFSVPEAKNYEFGVHSYEERMTMHVMHRFGAIIVFLFLCWFAITLYAKASSSIIKRLTVFLILALGVQIGLGVSNVIYALPIVIATMHNAVAALLLLIMVQLTYTMYRKC